MGAKLDTAGIEFLEGDFGVGRKPHVTKRKAVKKPVRSFDGVSSWTLIRELLSRHYVDLQVLGFWVVLALAVWIKLGR